MTHESQIIVNPQSLQSHLKNSMNENDRAELRKLIINCRQATLAVVENNEPFTAMVSYGIDADGVSLLIQLSNLSAHKRQLLAQPRCSVLICLPDTGTCEVSALPRIAIQGTAIRLDKTGPVYEAAKNAYLAKLPTSAIMFSLPDFDLFRITPQSGRYVAGFGRAFTLTAADF